MRTFSQPDEDDEFEAAKDLLIRRCLAWADDRGLPADPTILVAAVDSRHRSRDGRLAFWNAGQVRRFLLEWIPIRARLTGPDLLVRLTPLGMRAVRERMLADGRDAPLVGELVDAPPAGLLGVLAEHYTPETAAMELDGWLAARDGDVEPLVEAIRACPFRTRASAMLTTLTGTRPDGQSLLTSLRGDRVLGPLAVTTLLDTGALQPDDLTSDEQLLLMTEGLLNLLELAGPEEVMTQLTQMAGKDAPEIIETVVRSGHPATVGMDELRRLVAEPMRARRHRLRFAEGPRPGARGRHTGHGKRRRR